MKECFARSHVSSVCLHTREGRPLGCWASEVHQANWREEGATCFEKRVIESPATLESGSMHNGKIQTHVMIPVLRSSKPS